MNEEFLTIEEVADLLKCHQRTVRRWIKSNKLQAIRLGGRGQYRIKLADLRIFLDGDAQEGPADD